MKKSSIIIIIVSIVSAVFLIGFIIVGVTSFPANAIKYEEKVTESYSAIKVQEKRRADLLPNMAEAVKSYNKHEYETLVAVINARAEDGTISDEDVKEINGMIKVVLESYPELKSSENYKTYMNELAITENMITETRNAYNSAVSRYNAYVKHPIKKFFLNLTGYEVIEFEKLDYDVSEDAPTSLLS